jgi:hypothetical protein
MVDELGSWGGGWFPRMLDLFLDSGEKGEMVEALARRR